MCHFNLKQLFILFSQWIMNFPSPHHTFSMTFLCSFLSLNSCNANCSSKHLKLPESLHSCFPMPSLTHSLAHHCWLHHCWPFYWNSFPWSYKWPSIYQISGSVSSLSQLDLSVTLTSLTVLFFQKLFSSLDSKLCYF